MHFEYDVYISKQNKFEYLEMCETDLDLNMELIDFINLCNSFCDVDIELILKFIKKRAHVSFSSFFCMILQNRELTGEILISIIDEYHKCGFKLDKYDEIQAFVRLIANSGLKSKKVLDKMKYIYDELKVDILINNFVDNVIEFGNKWIICWLFDNIDQTTMLKHDIFCYNFVKSTFNGIDKNIVLSIIDWHLQCNKPLYYGFSIFPTLCESYDWDTVKLFINIFILNGFGKEIFLSNRYWSLYPNYDDNLLQSVCINYKDSDVIIDAIEIAKSVDALDTIYDILSTNYCYISTVDYIIAYCSYKVLQYIYISNIKIYDNKINYYVGCKCCCDENAKHAYRDYTTEYILKERYSIDLNNLHKIESLRKESNIFHRSVDDLDDEIQKKNDKENIAQLFSYILTNRNVILTNDEINEYATELGMPKDDIDIIKDTTKKLIL